MTKEEAKNAIKAEFISRYYEWLEDWNSLTEDDFNSKYPNGRGEDTHLKDNQKSVRIFQKYFFQGRWIQAWESAGYEKKTIYALNDDGFLSYECYTSHHARTIGRTEFFYISQKTAKEIWKEMRREERP